MDTYLVGGAVRDALLGLAVKDRDFVVVGETQASMEAAGFRAIGKDFPVFLHPETREEYALARTERKSGTGYRGFVVDADPSVTLEQDLARRDLTINAIAQRPDGTLVDPFGGRKDLQTLTLRHVSPAFVEDPVRVLRAARFMARFASLGFSLADETRALMQRMVSNAELDHLVPERVWQELDSALAADTPRAFVETLRDVGALAALLPELDALFGVPQLADLALRETAAGQVISDCGADTLQALDSACGLSAQTDVRFATLCHDLGKGGTPEPQWPLHPAHAQRGAQRTDELCQRLRIPRRTRDLAIMSARYHDAAHRVDELDDEALADLLQSLDALRRTERFAQFLLVCQADWQAMIKDSNPERDYPQAETLSRAVEQIESIDARAIAAATADKADIAGALRNARVAALRRWRANA